jgi:hypothetical protein
MQDETTRVLFMVLLAVANGLELLILNRVHDRQSKLMTQADQAGPCGVQCLDCMASCPCTRPGVVQAEEHYP